MPVAPGTTRGLTVGLDYFVLELFLLGLVFVPMERLWFLRRQKIFRTGWQTDLLHFFVSHAGVRMSAVPVDGCAELVARARGCDVVGIDEVQFFEPSVVDAALALAEGGARVIAAGLDQDFRRLPFGPMPELLARAELVDKLQAVCHRCGGPATTTQRLVDGSPAPYSGETIVVGALDSYEARCRDCHRAGADAVQLVA